MASTTDNLIHNRGRGPELRGTRVLVHSVWEFEETGFPTGEACEALGITEAQYDAAVAFCRSHPEETSAVLARVRSLRTPRRSEAEVHEGIERLKQRLLARTPAGTPQ